MNSKTKSQVSYQKTYAGMSPERNRHIQSWLHGHVGLEGQFQ